MEAVDVVRAGNEPHFVYQVELAAVDEMITVAFHLPKMKIVLIIATNQGKRMRYLIPLASREGRISGFISLSYHFNLGIIRRNFSLLL